MIDLRLNMKKCEPCSGNTEKFTKEKINKFLKQINSWSINDKQEMIFKKFKFKNYKLTIEFINKISNISEQEGHHPDISFGWGYCLVMLHTHAIKGLSINDFILASKIDEIV
tara:strand:- start:1763 stop:2098 length:336 start_codon:yes stop_codon:yes gene_type:complete